MEQQMTHCVHQAGVHISYRIGPIALFHCFSHRYKPDEDWCFESNILLKASFSALLVVSCRCSSNDLYQTKRQASKRSHGVSASRGDANMPAMEPRVSL